MRLLTSSLEFFICNKSLPTFTDPCFYMVAALPEVALGSVYPCGYGFASSVDGDHGGTHESGAWPWHIHMWLRVSLVVLHIKLEWDVWSSVHCLYHFRILVIEPATWVCPRIHPSEVVGGWRKSGPTFQTGFSMWQKTHICSPWWRAHWCCQVHAYRDEGEKNVRGKPLIV